MKLRWFVLAFVLLVLFPTPVADFCQGFAQSLISGADSVVNAPTRPATGSGSDG